MLVKARVSLASSKRKFSAFKSFTAPSSNFTRHREDSWTKDSISPRWSFNSAADFKPWRTTIDPICISWAGFNWTCTVKVQPSNTNLFGEVYIFPAFQETNANKASPEMEHDGTTSLKNLKRPRWPQVKRHQAKQKAKIHMARDLSQKIHNMSLNTTCLEHHTILHHSPSFGLLLHRLLLPKSCLLNDRAPLRFGAHPARRWWAFGRLFQVPECELAHHKCGTWSVGQEDQFQLMLAWYSKDRFSVCCCWWVKRTYKSCTGTKSSHFEDNSYNIKYIEMFVDAYRLSGLGRLQAKSVTFMFLCCSSSPALAFRSWNPWQGVNKACFLLNGTGIVWHLPHLQATSTVPKRTHDQK